MKICRLYIENFMCHEKSFIDFTQFNTALIVGKIENNDLYSNGVGKTTIFKSIEYVLFNQADVNLEKIIRDDAEYCRVVLDFLIDDQEYRISRTRTRKGTTDVSLHLRKSEQGDDNIYHYFPDSLNNKYYVANSKLDQKYWKDLSGSRASDTEKELNKLIKIGFKAFRSTIHFIQNDFTGLTTSTPEKRKGIFKDALNLIIYSKLEKIAKDKASLISKQIDKDKTLIDNLGDPNKELQLLGQQLQIFNDSLDEKNIILNNYNDELNSLQQKVSELINLYSNEEGKVSLLFHKQKTLLSEKAKIETSVKEYTSKKTNVIKQAEDLIQELKELKIKQTKLAQLDFHQIDIINESMENNKLLITENNVHIQNLMSKLEELKIPMPKDALCKHCRQEMSKKHREECQSKINLEINQCQEDIKKHKSIINKINEEQLKLQPILNSLNLSKKQLESINVEISSKNKEVSDKKSLYTDYISLLNKFTDELKENDLSWKSIQLEIAKHSSNKTSTIKSEIDLIKNKITLLNSQILTLNKEISHASSGKAVVQHNIDQKTKDQAKLIGLKVSLEELEKKFAIYPYVIQGFSSTGIPNLIIQNVLDDLQREANELLNQLKPGLQLSFSVSKTSDDGTEIDKLEINYQMNGKDRYYEQLSGAMKLAVTFSLKLGLSFLLQEIFGTNIKFLLLDEIDQSLDKASVDAFADIVKFFQKDFTILIITHNDRLKDKFSHAILVEQDINMVSRARVVSSW